MEVTMDYQRIRQYVSISRIKVVRTILVALTCVAVIYCLFPSSSNILRTISNFVGDGGHDTGQCSPRNVSGVRPYSYRPDVDLRVIVIAFDRAQSLQKCLIALDAADYGNSTVSIHVWIDRDKDTEECPQDTYEVANSFEFSHYKGAYRVHVQDSHVGIQGQWINTWRPRVGTKEVGVILEDDVDVSPYFWRWLQGASSFYYMRNDVSGYGLHGPGKNHVNGAPLRIPASDNLYMYPVICTWGFAPHPRSWRTFQDWFFTKGKEPSVDLSVPGILPWKWYKKEKARGCGQTVWEMWHIRFTYTTTPQQYNIQPNTDEGRMFAVNRQEKGLHFPNALGPSGALINQWKEQYGKYPESPPIYDASGSILTH